MAVYWIMRRLPLFSCVGFGLTLLLLAGDPLAAQTVQGLRGTVAEEGTGRAIGGAFVTVVDGHGERIGGGLTANDGSFLIDLPQSGTFGVQADRIGFQRTTTTEVVIPPGRLVSIDLVAPAQAIVIEGVAVEGERRCDLRTESGPQTALLWEEARKALDIALWTDGGGNFVYDAESWIRRYDDRGRQLLSESVDRRTHVGRHAFRALSPEELAENGFVQGSLEEGRSFFAPDAEVLMSTAFLDTHCFQATDEDGRLGLAFEPVAGRDQSEVEGTLWFAEGTSRLASLEYGYLNVDQASDDRFGGHVQFESLPGGAWIVREWEIRMPVLSSQRQANGSFRIVVNAVETAGGRVIEVRDAAEPRPLGRFANDQQGRVRGAVVDSTTGLPLEDAVVFISGTNRSARTDEYGDFELSGVPEGAYTLLVDHPRIAELGILSPVAAVEVEPGVVANARLELPSIRGLVADGCARVAGEPPVATEAALAGVVRTGGVPPAEFVVRVTWSQVERTGGGLGTADTQADIIPDGLGRWGVCRIPIDTSVQVSVLRGDDAASPVVVSRMAAGERRWLVVEAPETSR